MEHKILCYIFYKLTKEIKMAITKEVIQDKIEVMGDFKHIQVRTATVIKEDGVEISRSYHRHDKNS